MGKPQPRHRNIRPAPIHVHRRAQQRIDGHARQHQQGEFRRILPDLPLEEAIDTSERDSRLWGVIDKLPDQCRNVFLMSKRDGMTYAQIAEELNLSVRTVEHHISKALERLRDAVKGAALRIYFWIFVENFSIYDRGISTNVHHV